MADTHDRDGTVGGNGGSAPGRTFGALTRLVLWLGVISAIAVVLVIIAPINSWFPAATRQAGEVDALFKFMLAASAVIFIYVQGFLLDFALRYRRRNTDPKEAIGAQIHGNTRLEIAWSAVPAVLLLVIVIFSIGVWSDEQTAQKNELNLDVTGFQFGFNFSLPQYGITNNQTVVLPVNRPVYVSERSRDVIHAFWVPEFRIQYDMVPGIVTHERFTPTEVGTYRVICTSYCGTGHSGMHTTLKVGTQAQFIAWLRKNGGKNIPSGGTPAALIQP